MRPPEEERRKPPLPRKFRIAIWILFSLTALAWIYFFLPPTSVKVGSILEVLQLADLPAAVWDVKADSMGFPVTGIFARFRADPEDIDAWIDASPALRGAEPVHFGETRYYLPRGQDAPEGVKGVYYGVDPEMVPAWFRPTVRGEGRLYRLPPDITGRSGQVVVDDQTSTVYLYLDQSR